MMMTTTSLNFWCVFMVDSDRVASPPAPMPGKAVEFAGQGEGINCTAWQDDALGIQVCRAEFMLVEAHVSPKTPPPQAGGRDSRRRRGGEEKVMS